MLNLQKLSLLTGAVVVIGLLAVQPVLACCGSGGGRERDRESVFDNMRNTPGAFPSSTMLPTRRRPPPPPVRRGDPPQVRNLALTIEASAIVVIEAQQLYEIGMASPVGYLPMNYALMGSAQATIRSQMAILRGAMGELETYYAMTGRPNASRLRKARRQLARAEARLRRMH